MVITISPANYIPTAQGEIMSEGLTFRRAKKEDLPRISEFRKAFFEYNPSRSCEPEYYEWKCYKNPILPGEMWLAEDGNTLVGIKSMTPKRIKILAAVVDGAETGDTFTHPDYQRRGIFTRLFKAAKECGLDARIDFIYGLPNEISLLGYERKLDYAQVPIKLHTLVKPLKSKQVLKIKLRSPLLAVVLSPVIDAGSQAIFRIGMRGAAKSDVLIYTEPAFPEDIDTLWEQASKNYNVMLMRTKDYLDWRYVTNPDTYSILIARNRDGAILGYMVIKIGFPDNIPTGFICDFLTIQDDPNVFKKLLSTALQDFCHRKVSFVFTRAVKGSLYYRILLWLGFLPRSRAPIVCYRNELGNQVLGGHYKWHFTMGDSDSI